MAETIENNVRRLIIDEQPINPKYYEKMSELLDALIAQRRQAAAGLSEIFANIVELTKKMKTRPKERSYPKSLNTAAKRALYDNLGKNEGLALAIDAAVIASKQDDWRSNTFKIRKVRLAIKGAIESYKFAKTGESSGVAGDQPDAYVGKESGSDDKLVVEGILELVKNQNDY